MKSWQIPLRIDMTTQRASTMHASFLTASLMVYYRKKMVYSALHNPKYALNAGYVTSILKVG